MSFYSVVVLGSRFYRELVDKAFAETATMEFRAMDGTGTLCSYICCDSQKMPDVLIIVENIFSNLSKNGITEEELEKAKNKALSIYVIQNETQLGRLVSIGVGWTYRKQYISVEDHIKAIRAVTPDDINSIINQFYPGDFTQLSMGPSAL